MAPRKGQLSGPRNPNWKGGRTVEKRGYVLVKNGRLNWTGVFRELPERLDQPLRWRRPRRIFVNSMSDLFGEGISDEFVEAVFRTMRDALQHRFQVLTKRPERMARLVPQLWGHEPYRNVWLGTSVEDQKAADLRIPHLLATPAAIRFLSCEPLLGPLDLDPYFWEEAGPDWAGKNPADPGIDWVIAGGESGPGARLMGWTWLYDLKRQCQAAGVPLFIKQLGSVAASAAGMKHPEGGDPSEWPAELRIREWPEEPS